MLSRIFRAAGATMVALAVLFAVPAHAANKTVAGITVDTNPTSIQRGVAYSFQIAPTGPSGYAGSYTYSLISGSLPSGVTLSASGLLSGLTCETNGPRDFGVRIATIETTPRTADFSGGNTFSVNVNGPPGGSCALPITGTIPAGTVGTAYSGSVSASGGIGAPYTFSINSGALPPGLTLSAAGAITGTPTTAGTYTFVVRGRDGDSPPSIGLASFSITIAAVPVTLVVNPATLPGGTTTVSYSQTITATAGTGPYSYNVSAGTLPGGLSLSVGGTLSGTPTTAGTYNFTVRALDSLGNTGTRAYSVTIAGSATLAVNPATLTNATNHQAYAATITAANGAPAYTFAVTSGALPAGFTLAPGGALSGTPNATGSYSFTVTATDANGNFGSRAYTLVIDPVTITVNPATLPGGANGAAYNEAIGASGGTAPYTYSVTAGALPNGLTLVGGTLSGTPTAAGTFNFTIQAQDPNGDTGSRAYSVTIAAATITVSPGSLPAATNGTSYNQALTASGGTGPYDFNVTAGALPNGMTLSSSGTLSGTPNATAGTFNFTIEVTDANGDTVTQSFSITVNAATITVNPATLPGGTNGVAYNEAIGASGGTAPYTYSLTAGALPTGVSLAGGTIAGTPTAAGTFNFTLEAQDANGDTGSRAYSVTIASATITVSPGSLPAATNGASYSQALTASGGTGPYDFNLTSGALPNGMTLSSSGTLSGTPNAAAGTFNFTIEVTDANGDTVTQSFSITVNAATITVNPATLPGGTNGVAYNEAIGASGGTAPYTYSLTAGALPTGVSLAGGMIAGTPTAAGTFNFTIEAQDANGDTGSRAYTVTVAAATIEIGRAHV